MNLAARTRTVAYLRVSTDKQADHGVSLDEQRAKVEAYACLYDLDLVAVEVDPGASAKNLHREGLQSALSRLQSGEAEALLVAKLDRLTRSVVDLGELVERFQAGGWALMSVGEQVDTRTAAGRMILNIMATISQWERETIGERTAAAMAHKRSKGQRVGAVPYGYRLASDDTHLEPEETEQQVIAIARELREAGLSLRAVAHELDGRGFRSRTGRVFAPTQIKRMVA